MATGNGIRGGRGFLTEEEKQNKPQITGKLLKRIFGFLLPYRLKLLLVITPSLDHRF